MKTFGYAGKILRVDLTNRRVSTKDTMIYARRFLGGKGINQWLLYNEVKLGIWPFDPANIIVFGTGPLTGTLAPGACRYSVDSKNALTGGVGSANSGGHFGPELKFAGYDHVVIYGRSRKPCFLWIDDYNVEIRDAKHLWGKTTWETDDLIRENLEDEDIQIASIGPAGENLVRAACIINNGGRVAGRCGLGAVMGSKNLKAVAVRGSGEISIARPEEFMRVVEELWEKIEEAEKRDFEWAPSYRGFDASLGLTYHRNEYSGNQVRNFQDGFWDREKARRVSEKELAKYGKRILACFACPKPHYQNWYLKISEGEFKGTEGEGFYTNTRRNFGCKLDIDNLEAIIKAHILCSQYGLDVDNTAGSIAWAMECYQRGILTEKNTEGLKLEWGNYRAVLELIRKIAYREDFGDLLAEGCKRASEKVGKGSEKYCMHIKGQDLYEQIRTTIGWGFGAIVAPRGGGHLDGSFVLEDSGIGPELSEKVYGVPTAGDRKTYEGKAKLVVYFENFNAVVNSLGICILFTHWDNPYLLDLEDLTRLFSAATGRNVTVAELIKIGERINNVMKAFNVREGMTRKDDYPPDRFFEPIESGPGKGECLVRKKYEKMLDEYYTLRGWDTETGLPTNLKLEELGLSEVAEELEKLGKVVIQTAHINLNHQ